jgi:dihydrofolate synthase/folylpolyglutamate synthase
MDKTDPLDFLFSLTLDSRMSLQEMFYISKILGFPQNSYKAIHVAGSNGKGSVCHKIARALQNAGYRVGLFTSPHIHCYSERFQINGQNSSIGEVKELLNHVFSVVRTHKVPINYFQVTTLVSLLFFQKQEVDVVVVETGIGGRLDATRLFNPILSVITSISLEHTAILGNTLEKIGREKAGICRKGIPLVLGSKVRVSSILEIAASLGCPVHISEESEGFYDTENSLTAKKALFLLKDRFEDLNDDHIANGLLSRPACRFEMVGNFIFDVAHNPDGISRLLENVAQQFRAKKVQAIVGLSSDKDIKKCLQVLTAKCSKLFLVETSSNRTARLSELKSALTLIGWSNFESFSTVEEAVLKASKNGGEITVVCGSFYIMDRAKAAYLTIDRN